MSFRFKVYIVGFWGFHCSVAIWMNYFLMRDSFIRLFFMVVNHSSSFVNEPQLHYNGGDVHVYHGHDTTAQSIALLRPNYIFEISC